MLIELSRNGIHVKILNIKMFNYMLFDQTDDQSVKLYLT